MGNAKTRLKQLHGPLSFQSIDIDSWLAQGFTLRHFSAEQTEISSCLLTKLAKVSNDEADLFSAWVGSITVKQG